MRYQRRRLRSNTCSHRDLHATVIRPHSVKNHNIVKNKIRPPHVYCGLPFYYVYVIKHYNIRRYINLCIYVYYRC